MKWFVREKVESIGSHEVGLVLDFCGYSAIVSPAAGRTES